jgi:translocation and assembly module TamB
MVMKRHPRARRIAGKLVRWTLGGLLGLVLLVASCLTLLLYSPGFLQLVLDTGLGYYNDRIPGEIRIGRVEGRLIDRLVLGDIFLADRDGRGLVVARQLAITWDPWALLHGALEVEAIELDDVRVTMTASGFADLAIPGPPEPPRDTILPELPVDLAIAGLRIKGLDVVAADTGEALVGDLRLALRDLIWSGRRVSLKIDDAAARLPGVKLEALALAVLWSEPRLELRGLVTTELAIAELLQVDLDARTLDGHAMIAVDGRRGALAELIGGALAERLRDAAGDPVLLLDARTTAGRLDLGAHFELSDLADLDLSASMPLRGAPDLTLRARAMTDLGPRHGQLRPLLSAKLAGDDWSRLRGELHLDCGDCGPLSGLHVQAEARHDAVLGASAGRLELAGLGLQLRAEATAGPRGLEAGHWDLHVPNLAEPVGLARSFAVLPPLDGAVATRGSCTGAPLRCEGTLEVERFVGHGVAVAELRMKLQGEPLAKIPLAHAELSARGLRLPGYHFAGAELAAGLGPSRGDRPVLEGSVDAELWVKRREHGDRARLRARVRPGPPLAIDLAGLDLHLRGLYARLPHAARIQLAGRRLDVDGLALLVAGGALSVDGHADLDGPSDLRVALHHVQLAPLTAVVPKLRAQLGGSISATATLAGLADSPTLRLNLGGKRLRYRGGAVGDLALAVQVRGGRARATLDLRGPLAAHFNAKADLPLALDLSRGEFGVSPGPLHLALDLEHLRLVQLRPWLGRDDTPLGRIDAKIAVDGPAAAPTTTIAMHGRGVLIGDDEAPAVFDFNLSQKSGEDAVARLDARRLAGRVRLDVPRLPLRVNLVAGGLQWRPERRHTATLVLRDFDLWRQLGAVPGNDYYGRIEVEGGLDGPLTDPALKLTLTGEGLRVRDAQIGRLRADLELDARRATLDVALRGEVIQSASIHAAAPLRIAPARGELAWLKDQPHELDARLEHFDLAQLKNLGVTAKMAGIVDVSAKLDGPMHEPRLAASAGLRGFVWNNRPVGNASVDLSFRDGRAELALRSAVGRGTIDGRASVPVAVDLGRGKVEWDERGQSEVELRVDGLDRTMLAPLGRVPEEALIELSLRARARGNLRDFAATLEAHGQTGHKLIGGAPVHITADIGPNTQALRFHLGPHKWAGEIEIKTDTRADIVGLTRGKASAGDIPFTASMRAEHLDSRFIQGFVPREYYDLNGVLDAHLDAKGTLGDPDIDGALKLRRGSITVLELQQRIRRIELDLRARGRKVVLERLTAESGTGTLSATATADFPRGGGFALDSELLLRRFPLVRPGLPQMQIDSHIRTKVAMSARATDVQVRVDGTRVAVTGYTIDPPRRIPENPNVRFRDRQELVPVATTDDEVKAENEERTPRPEKPAPSKRSAIEIKLLEPVEIRGPAIEMAWKGAVQAVSEGEKRDVTGLLTAKEGRFDLLGNSFKVESGQVTLPEDEHTIDPFINVVARTSTATAEVTATVKGRASHPSLTFSSEPAMSQSQILTLLLTGSADASEADEQRVLAQAAALLATFENPGLSNFISSRLGIDRIGLSFGDDVNQPILSVGKRLSKNIYVETAFKFNAPRNRNRVEVRVEYEFRPNWTLETFFGDAAVGGVDLFWHRVFGQPRRREGNTGAVPKGTGQAGSPRGRGGGGDGGGAAAGGAGGAR